MFDAINELNRQSNQWFYETTGIGFEQFLVAICWIVTIAIFVRTTGQANEVPKLREEIDKLKKGIAGLQEENTDLVTEIDDLRHDMRKLKNTDKEAIQDLASDISELQGELHALSAGMLVRQL